MIKKISRSALQSVREHFRAARRSFELIWTASPAYTTVWAVLLVLQGIVPGVLVYLTKLVVDALVVAINARGDWEQLRPAVVLAVALAGVMLLSDVLQSVLEMVRTAQADIIQDFAKGLVHKKSAELDMAHFESAEYHDRLEQATSDGAARPLSLLESTGGVVQNSISLLVMAGLLMQYSVWLPALLLISTLPAFVIVLRFDRKYHRWWKATTNDRRWIQYFDRMLTHHRAAAEMRVFGISPLFQNRYQELRKRLRTEKLAQMRSVGLAKLLAGTLSIALLGLALASMGWRAVAGALTLGDLALFYQAFSRGQGLMRTMLSSVGQMIKNGLFVEVLFEFLDLRSTMTRSDSPVTAPKKLVEGIRFRNVTFRYPGTDRYIFRDLSLFIPADKALAIVGENGSGKTTLIKLICRFYDPESGTIEVDGIDIRRFDPKELMKLITITFQLPLNYHATVRESIGMGDLSTSSSTAEIEKAAKGAGADEFISRLSDGYDTLLGRVHANGAELSGGEWQRLALARAYFRKAPIVLLDEPTSFMDSWAESDWFHRFRQLTKGRTAVVITHRFSIAMRADIIYVFQDGQVVESGSHSELVAARGLYAESWEAQMQVADRASRNGEPALV